MKTISLTQLLSSCMDASLRGCEVIRSFQMAHQHSTSTSTVGGRLKEGGNIKSVVTQADIDAQAIIVGGLRQAWGDDLLIIGEEDEAEAIPNFSMGACRKNIFLVEQPHGNENFNLLKGDGDGDDNNDEIPLEDIALFVDPLDGTREFVEGRLENVGCLIGIAQKSRPIAGVIGIPFPNGSLTNPARVHYAIANQPGSAGIWPISDKVHDKETTTNIISPPGKGFTILTGDSKDKGLQSASAFAKSYAADPNVLLVGGTAAKLGFVATNPNCIAMLHPKTELWDTCAPQSLIESNGGMVTDLFGAPLDHSPNRSFGNVFGVVASSGEPDVTELHKQLCAHVRGDLEPLHHVFQKWMGPTVPQSPQAVDIARNLDGIPFSVADIQNMLLSNARQQANLISYSVPESGAWRGMMSNGCRFYLEWDKDSTDTTSSSLPTSIFYKRVVMADLAHARDKLKSAPHKLIRDVKSYLIETSFLTSRACRSLLQDTGLRINKVYGSDLRPVENGADPKDLLNSKFSIFLEDFDTSGGWEQQWLLDERGAMAALAAFAKLHAYFWTGSNFWKKESGALGEELKSIVWENGGYMQPKLQGLDQLEKVASGWEHRYPTFRENLSAIPELQSIDFANLGARLQKVAAAVGEKAHPFGSTAGEYEKYKTFIHGDPKQANIFFRSLPTKDLEVGLIDFQWSGFGLAATDVAHFISAAVSPLCVSHDGAREQLLLDHYYSCLCKSLVEFGAATSVEHVETDIFPRDVFAKQYEIALLDVCRMVFAYAWRRWKAETEPTPESFNRNAYNKSVQSALWLISRCHALLDGHNDI